MFTMFTIMEKAFSRPGARVASATIADFCMFSGNLGSTMTFSKMPSDFRLSEKMSCLGTRTNGFIFSRSMYFSM